ncbi:PadR family transcriptional regulator [Roseivirga pacifica]|uniref:PadR family transcriptional regulator n=1 Tax=Roseivirga pacifica TaxID=1267423 RepID=UPI00209512B6|nr:helix-turn-helix transcriptional regulator [Roseivirga pacifica]MCO6357116.1 PadR family transcriptional regulator [Roseivirga pacifica]MCO6368171.1 PadR family transcriptional regulator [Roseivirga pacifica]MCO6369348.1 PadR family transcriptional regulator [Roseivirga pacifica]MCO6373202.1 PadR family transcriptional regulator [Roseivirga pacifica]MCO6377541.1 PadR family transcriptional regulator [Roseivirga pacifica]
MGKNHLGEFEEIVLLTVAILHGEAYGVAIIDEMESRLNRSVSIGSLQTVLRRLEDKGYLSSEFGEATSVRGGKRKRFFSVTTAGKKVLREAKEQRMNLWNAIPDFALND